ncbi:TetR/AcrR family transcriptional regulator [Streptomyces kaniharaensis]|uniref:TetR/AcrR family transcriptional regulator n=1 Tax=Streptomyces kaniharaensis TaxID=212423 RepID=A0A6N7KUD6_9ACTN|nr:TetR family transcriptional regulator [Streptomyces kaniharaensis]MQS15051.1 TetR/AcrR family transcriptional regulator [Streptomyces kaniharaensis]
MTTDTTLTAEQILTAAEDALRRFGPAKATVVDVARTLGVSHSSVYRHFPSKAALREAVTQRWLDQAHFQLAFISTEPGPAEERLHRWLVTLFAAKRKKALDDPELFATYRTLVEENSRTVGANIDTLVDQIAQIVQDGMEKKDFKLAHILTTARAVFDATAHFHHPAYASEWSDPQVDERFEAVWTLILNGLRAK